MAWKWGNFPYWRPRADNRRLWPQFLREIPSLVRCSRQSTRHMAVHRKTLIIAQVVWSLNRPLHTQKLAHIWNDTNGFAWNDTKNCDTFDVYCCASSLWMNFSSEMYNYVKVVLIPLILKKNIIDGEKRQCKVKSIYTLTRRAFFRLQYNTASWTDRNEFCSAYSLRKSSLAICRWR